MKTERIFYKNFFSIYILLVLQNVVTISVNLADNVMLGGYSEAALSGVAAVNQIQFVYQQLLTALGDGLVIFCSQYWGKKETEPMHRISAAAMRAGLLIALVLFTAVSLFPEEAVGLFTTEHTIIREGAAYLGIVKYTYFFFAVTMILLATLRSVETVRIAFALSIMAFFINCGINYVLIYGKFGAPELGARGAAIAANSAASTLFLLVKSTAVGASSTASVVIGKTIGTGNIPLVKHYSSVMQRLFVVIGILSGLLLFVLRIPVMTLYDLSAEAMSMMNTFLIILSVVCVGMSYQMPTNNGIIRGGGNAMFVVKMDLISIWMIVLPLSFVMAFVVKASPAVVVCCLNADQIFKCVPAFLESHYGNWIRRLTR